MDRNVGSRAAAFHTCSPGSQVDRYPRLMGRASRKKRERREAGQVRPDRAFRRLDRESALAVITAASVSPSACHRLPSLAAATVTCWQTSLRGTRRAEASDLELLCEVGVGDENYAILEHDEPLDIRLGTRVRWGTALYRAIPGGWERPVAIVADAGHRSRAFDRFLEEELGFGIRDLVELALLYSDDVVGCLATSWPAVDPEEPWHYGPGHVSDAEVAGALRASKISETVARCARPPSAAAALAWASRSPGELSSEPSMSEGPFGPVLAVFDGGQHHALPAGFMLDGVHASVGVLTALALEDDRQRERWERLCASRTLHTISGRGALLAPDAQVGDEEILAVIQMDDGLLLAVDNVIAGVPGRGVADAEERLRRFAPGVSFSTDRGTTTIRERDEVLRLAVIHGTDSMSMFAGEEALPVSWMGVDDLRWITTQSERPDDLPMFLRDWNTKQAEHLFAFGPFDLFEVWAGNGGMFHRRGQMLSALSIAPHHEAAEWAYHAQMDWAEQALIDLGLAGLASWPVVIRDDDDDAHVTVIDRPARDAVAICRIAGGNTVAAVRYDPTDRVGVPPSDVAAAIGWKFRHLRGSAEHMTGDRTIRIEVVRDESVDELVCSERRGASNVLTYGSALDAAFSLDPGDGEHQVALALAAVAPGSDDERVAFVEGWDRSPRGLLVDATSVPQAANDPGDSRPPHPSLLAAAERAAATVLYQRGVAPGVRRAEDARDLESKQIHPILRDLLLSEISPFDAHSLIKAAAEDLERSHANQWREDGHHARRSEIASDHDPTRAPEVLEDIADQRTQRTILSQTITIVIEEAVCAPPEGSAEPTAFERDRIYAVARGLMDSGLRSETIHQRLSDAELEITDGYEIEARSTGGGFDLEAFNRARSLVTMPGRQSPPRENDQPMTVTAAMPELGGIDAALIGSLGFGVDALLGVPEVLTGWPVENWAPVATATVNEVCEFVAENLAVDIDPGHLRAAAEWLTLTPEGLRSDLGGELIEHWELDRRAHRLAVRPLIRGVDRGLLVLPWAAGRARQILLGNLRDGRLPWPERALPQPVVNALAGYRLDRNRELEAEALAALQAANGFGAIGNVKKARVLGLASLPRELDVVCLDESRRRIWVIEVKDLAIAWSPGQIRRAIDKFNGPGGFSEKMADNLAHLSKHSVAVAAALGAEAPDGPWELNGLFVTRRVEPGAFAEHNNVGFCTPDALVETISTAAVAPGRYAIEVERATTPS